jgi:hypothetical protein
MKKVLFSLMAICLLSTACKKESKVQAQEEIAGNPVPPDDGDGTVYRWNQWAWAGGTMFCIYCEEKKTVNGNTTYTEVEDSKCDINKKPSGILCSQLN